MDEYPNNITITNAMVFSKRIISATNSKGIEILTFMAHLIQSQTTIIIQTTEDKMLAAMLSVYTRHRINPFEQPSILRINVTGQIRRARTLNQIEHSPVTPLFAVIATSFHIIDFNRDDNYTGESLADITDDNDDIKDTDYSEVKTTKTKHTTKAVPKSSSKRRKTSEPSYPNSPRRGRSPSTCPK